MNVLIAKQPRWVFLCICYKNQFLHFFALNFYLSIYIYYILRYNWTTDFVDNDFFDFGSIIN